MLAKRINTQAIFLYCDSQSPLFRYGLAALTVAVAAVTTQHIPVIGQRAVFLLFFFAIVQSAFWLGYYPGILAMVLSTIAVNTLVMLPHWISNPREALILNAGFCGMSAIFIATTNLHRNLMSALLEKQQELNHAQTIGNTGNWRLDMLQNELRWSDENYRIFGIPKGTSLTYETFLATVHPDDRDYVDQKWQAALRGEPYDIEHRVMVAGKVKWVHERAELQFDNKGGLLGGFGTTQDITYPKHANAALQERENELRLIMDAAPALIAYLDSDFRYLRVNKTYENWFCLHQESILGHTAREIIGERAWGIVSPYLDRARAGERVSFDYQVPYGTGKPRWVQASYVPNKDENGEVIGIVVHVTDIEDRKQAEFERQKFVSLADNSQEFIGMCDMNFKPFYVNAAGMDLVGLVNQEQAFRTPVQEFFFPEDQHFIINEFFPRVKFEGRGEVEIRFRHFQTGAVIWMIYNVFHIKNDDGQTVAFATVSRDISARKQAELALEESERKSRFLAAILENSIQPFGTGFMDGTIGYVNHAFEQLTGYSREELLAMDWATGLTPPEWQEYEQTQIEKLLSTQQAVRYEKEYFHKDGTRIPIELMVEMAVNNEGQPVQYYAFITDLTDRKQAEITLREGEEKLRQATERHLHELQVYQIELEMQNTALEKTTIDLEISHSHYLELFDFAPVGYLTLTTEGIIEEINLTASTLLGIERNNLKQRRFAQFIQDDQKDRWYQFLTRAARQDGKQNIELPIKDKEGNSLFVHIDSLFIKTGGSGTQLRLVLTNITTLKQVEMALRATEERVRLATEATGVGIWEWNVISNQIRWDAQMFRIYGIDPTPDGLIDYRTWSRTVVPEDLPYQEEVLQNTARRGGRSARDFRILTHCDKELRHIHAVETVRTHDSGIIEWVVGSNLDITELKKTTQALQASEDRLALGVQVAGLALAEVDYTTGLVHLSTEAAQIFGLGETEMVVARDRVHATFHPDDRSDLLRLIDECLAPSGNGWFDRQHRVVMPKGDVRWLHVRKQITFSGDGEARKPLRATLAIHDITTEKQAAEAVLASEIFVRSVLNSLPEHVVVLDCNGIVKSVNEPWERFASENEGIPHSVSIGANYLAVCRRSSAAGDTYAHQALIGLEDLFADRRQEFVMEYPCPTPSLLRWFLMHAKRAGKGIEGVILSHVDITERKVVENELRNAQARLALVIEEVKAGYWDWDLIKDTLYLSPEWKRQLGFSENELASQWEQKEDRLHPDDRAMVSLATESFINGSLPDYDLQFRLRHKNGSYRWIHCRGALIRNENGHPTRMLGLNLDITDYARTKELSERRDAMEKSFRLYVASQTAAAIAHELNQPLTAISYYAYVVQEMLKSENPNLQKLGTVMDKCGQQAQRAGDVIKQLLALLHKGETISEPVDINASVESALDFVKSYAPSNSFKIVLNLADDLPIVMANALQVQKILVNLLTNALESMLENGLNDGILTVTTRCSPNDPSKAQVTVCDCGVEAADTGTLKKMFQPFYSTKATGLGMGLAISSALVEAHGGKMWAEPNAGKGISVHFTLPFVP